MTNWSSKPDAAETPSTPALEDYFTVFIRKKAAKDLQEKKRALVEKTAQSSTNTRVITVATPTSCVATNLGVGDLIDFGLEVNNNFQVNSSEDEDSRQRENNSDPAIGGPLRHSHFQVDIGNLTSSGDFLKQKHIQTTSHGKRYTETPITTTNNLNGVMQHQRVSAKPALSEVSDVDNIVARTKAIAKRLGISKATLSQIYLPLPVKASKVAAPEASIKAGLYNISTPLVKLIHCSANRIPGEFLVEKSLLCKFSSVCEAKLGHDSMNETPQTYRIRSILTDSSFRILLNWLHYQRIPDHSAKLKSLVRTEKIKRGSGEMQELVGLWLLADEIEIAPLQNAVLLQLEQLLVESGGYTLDLVENLRDTVVGKTLGAFFTNRFNFYQLDHHAKALLLPKEGIAQQPQEGIVFFDPIKLLEYQITRNSDLIQKMQTDLQTQVDKNRELQFEFFERVNQRKLEMDGLIQSLKGEIKDPKSTSSSRCDGKGDSIVVDEPICMGENHGYKLTPLKSYFK